MEGGGGEDMDGWSWLKPFTAFCAADFADRRLTHPHIPHPHQQTDARQVLLVIGSLQKGRCLGVRIEVSGGVRLGRHPSRFSCGTAKIQDESRGQDY